MSIRQRETTSGPKQSKRSDDPSPGPSSSPSAAGGVSSTPVAVSGDVVAAMLVDDKKKWKSWSTRFWTTWAMLGGFAILMYIGHTALVGLIVFCQVVMYKEIKRLTTTLSKEKPLASFRPLHWYWFITAIFFTYGIILEECFNIYIPYHSFISFSLWAAGVVGFVLSLEKNYYRVQFEMFAWVHLALILVVVQSSFIIVNLFQGLIWFVLPALLIVSNDVWAYVFGFFFGRTPLIQLSPKKTWEGFSGALVMTMITGYLLPLFFIQFDYFICPKQDLMSFAYPSCEPSEVFILTKLPLPPIAQYFFSYFGSSISTVYAAPMQFYGLLLACFASLIAPFGGFFASGFKRAFGIKDFGESIPGHGGVTDRMDCQIMMGAFVFVLYWNFVRGNSGITVDVNHLIASFLKLSQHDQIVFYQAVKATLQQLPIPK